jgi:ubiquinone/menaquinone biosynthesis C-methylase UbiE
MGSFAYAMRKYDAIESRLTAPVSERMLDLANVRAGTRVLDLASGCGEPAVRAARRVGASGSVLGLDISDALLELAREKARGEGLSNIELRVADAEPLHGLPDAAFDAVTSRWGMMYMRSPATALSNVRRVLAPGGHFVAALWAEPARCSWVTLPREVLARYREVPSLESQGSGAFRYANLADIERDLQSGGFTLSHCEEIDTPVIEAASGVDIVAWVNEFGLLPLADALSAQDRARYDADLADAAEQHRTDGVIRLGGVTRLVVAR